ncbi:MAG TPA: CHASE domain-containing protein, partial [Burkholderiales bacterium]|nr:CHASE domain-containing protein [Burkholderiales bacterium]
MIDKTLPSAWHARPPWSYVVATLAAGLLIAVIGSYIHGREEIQRHQQRSTVERDVAAHAAMLQRRLDRSMATTMLLATLVRQHTDVQDLSRIAAEIAANFQGVETLEFAPQGIVAASFPSTSRQSVIGTRLLDDPARRNDAQRARDTGKLVVSSPETLKKGGETVVATLPVFTSERAGIPSFWGFISVFIRIADAIEHNGFDEAFLRQYRFFISTDPAGTPLGAVYGNSTEPLSQPVSWPVRLASGNELFVHAEPAGGWPSRPVVSLEFSLLCLAALLLAVLTQQLLERPARLRRQVEQRTRELSVATTRLEREIDRGQLAQRHIAWLSRIYLLLSRINEVIVRTRDRDALLQKVCDIMIEAGTFGYACIYLQTPEHEMRPVAAAGDDRDCVAHLKEMLSVPDDGSQASGAPFPVCHADASCVYSCNAGYASCAVFPVRGGDRMIGALLLFTDDRTLFGEEQKVILDRLAEDLSYALETIDLDQRTMAAEENVRLAARVLEYSAEGILITDAHNNILLVNKAFVATTGYTADEVIGRNPRLLHSGTHDPAFYHSM